MTGEETGRAAYSVVLPVGYQAARDPGSATTAPRIRVRAGSRYVDLAGRDDVGMWLLAHGSWAPRRSGWGREDVLAAAAEREIADPAGTFSRLAGDGLIASASSEAQLRTLAERYRLCTLLYCVGDLGDGAALAVADSTTRVRLEPRELAVWRHVPRSPTIWDAALSGADDRRMDVFHPFRSPQELLAGILAGAQYLISRGGAYVDLPVHPRPPQVGADD